MAIIKNILKQKFHISTAFLVAALAVAGLAVYANTFSNAMFWDDNDFILNNQYIRDWQYFPKFFSENIVAGSGLGSNYWRPALLTVFSLQWHAWQGWTVGYHVVNTLFHVADGLLLFFILRKIFKRKVFAFAVSLIFLVHPLQTEAVSYANSLGDSLSVFFIFSGLLSYLRFKESNKEFFQSVYWYLAVLAYALALLSKETAIIMPALVLLADWFRVGEKQESLLASESPVPALGLKQKILSVIKNTSLFFILGLVYVLLRGTLLNFGGTFNLYSEQNIFSSHIFVRVLTFFRIFAIYLKLIFWPTGLHMERSVAFAVSWKSFDVIVGGFLFLSVASLAFSLIKKYPQVSFGLLWFLVGLAPTSNIAVPINGLMYEHWLYLPLVGFAAAVIAAASAFIDKGWRISLALKYFSYGLFAVVVVVLSALTIKRNFEWRDPVDFYLQVLRYTPTSYRIVNNLGMTYAERGERNNAVKYYRQAIGLMPDNPVAHHNLGNEYLAMGFKQQALAEFKAAIDYDPKFLYSYSSLIKLYLDSGNQEEARKAYEQYLRVINNK